MKQLVLSLFPGADLLGLAFDLEGFAVVQGPDVIFGRDIRNFHVPAGRFDGVIGGPPCQLFSRLRHINKNAGAKHGNMIPEFERVILEAEPRWFVMENVPEAPAPGIPGYQTVRQTIRDVWVGGETSRTRTFTFGERLGDLAFAIDTLALHAIESAPAVTASDGGRWQPVKLVRDGNGGHKAKRPGGALLADRSSRSLPLALRHQGLPETFFDESPLTASGKRHVLGNGVPLPMGRAVARAVKRALGLQEIVNER